MSVRTKAEQRLQAETLCPVSAVASRMTVELHVVIPIGLHFYYEKFAAEYLL